MFNKSMFAALAVVLASGLALGNPTLTIDETITGATNLNNQTIPIPTGNVTSAGVYKVTFTATVSGLQTNQNWANALFVPTFTGSGIGADFTHYAPKVESVDVFSSDWSNDSVESLYQQNQIVGANHNTVFVAFNSGVASYTHPGQSLDGPAGSGYETITIGTLSVTWDGSGPASMTTQPLLMSNPGANSFSTWDNNGTIDDNFVGSAGPVATAWPNDQMTYNGNTITLDYASNQVMFVAATPEPASLSLLALGGLAMLRRRK